MDNNNSFNNNGLEKTNLIVMNGSELVANSDMGPPTSKPTASVSVDNNHSSCLTPSDSSGKTTASSSESNSTPSSSNTAPVSSESQDTPDTCASQELPLWGVVIALQPEFFNLNLIKDQYLFGRAKGCDYSFDVPSIKNNKYHRSYSKMHFAIKRITGPDGSTSRVILEDLGGTNGTFINGKKLTSKMQQHLQANDKIALSYSWNNVFLFLDNQSRETHNLPTSFSDKYILGKSIGKGACGEVFEAYLKEGVSQFACKVISKSRLSISANSHNRNIMIEAQILQQLHHPCIIAVEDVIDCPENLYIVLEYAAGGELFDRLSKKGPIPESITKLYFYQMLCAVSYLHENGITHRDLKPENILLMSQEEPCLIKITDFGMSRLVEEKSLMLTLAGTPSYLAPEIIDRISSQSSPGYTKLVDMWSLGVILYVCLVAYPPFSNDRKDTPQDIFHQIKSVNFNFAHLRWNSVSQLAKQLISFLLKLNSSERLTTVQALEHPWLNDTKMQQEAAELMEPNRNLFERSLMGEQSLSNDSYDTRKISTDVDAESNKSSSFGKSDSDEFISHSKRKFNDSDEKPNLKKGKVN